MDKKFNKRTFDITHEQHQILVGIVLADGSLELSPNKKSVRMSFSQVWHRKFYVTHVWQKFKDWTVSGVKYRLIKRPRGEDGEDYGFRTKFSPTLLPYYNLFFRDGKKQLPDFDFDKAFTSLSLTHLYMDDGGIKSKESKGVFINTYDLPIPQQERFCKFLHKRFGLQVKLVPDGKDYRIFISGKSYETFMYLINLHILPGFEHKLPPSRNPNSRHKKPVHPKAFDAVQKENSIELDSLIGNDLLPFFNQLSVP